MVRLLNNHLCPKPIKTTECVRFDKRDRKVGKSIAEYIAQLKKLSIHYDLNASFNEKLRYRLVRGVRNAQIQKRFLSKKSYETTIEISIAMEAAAKDATELQSRNRTESGAVNDYMKKKQTHKVSSVIRTTERGIL